jgi:hypothetical protein
MMSDHPISLWVQCQTPQEAEVAIAAIKAHRGEKKSSKGADKGAPPGPTPTLSDRIEAALRSYPPNPQKTLLQKTLFEVADGKWMPFAKIKEAFSKVGLEPSQAAAALRDLSWTMREFLPPEDIKGLDKPICVLAERTRSAGSFNYRLTSAGRDAVGHYLDH